jgi:hypothetical protein
MNLYRFPCDLGEYPEDNQVWDEVCFAESIEDAYQLFCKCLQDDPYNLHCLHENKEWIQMAPIQYGIVEWK